MKGKFLSKEIVVTRRQGSETLKFGIKQVDIMGKKFSTRRDDQVDVSSVSPSSERSKLDPYQLAL